MLKTHQNAEITQGTLIRMARIGQGLTQEELGNLVGLSQRQISDIESGGGTTGVMIYRIEKALNQSSGTFMV